MDQTPQTQQQQDEINDEINTDQTNNEPDDQQLIPDEQTQPIEPDQPTPPTPYFTFTILAKEFIFFSLPYLYFIFAAFYRLYKLHQQKENLLQRNSIRSQLSDEDLPKNHTPSLRIKITLSYWLCFVCTISMMLGFFGYIMTISFAMYFIWIIPIIAHAMAIILLNYEFKIQEQQAIWTHRIFWPLQTAFLVARMIQQYQTLLNIILVILQLIPSLILFIYALYRPNDQVRIQDDTPKVAKAFMKFLEECKIFQVNQDNRASLFNRNKKKDNTMVTNQLSSAFTELIKSKNQIEQEQFLADRLPERTVSISKQIKKKFVNDNEILYSYQINSIINGCTFQCEKRYPEFLNIERVQIDNFNKYNVCSFKIQRIDLQLGEDEYSYVLRRREYLEKWLQEQLQNPMYITKQLLEFLNIDEDQQQPFLIYQQLLSKQKNVQRNKSYQKSIDIELPALRVNSEENLTGFNLSDVQFTSKCVQCEYGIYGSNSLEFVINIKYKVNNVEQVYRILKTLSSIRQFSEQLEQSHGKEIHPQLKVQKTVFSLSKNEKIAYVDEFFQLLLHNQEYFSNELFEFINFDIINKCHKDHQ